MRNVKNMLVSGLIGIGIGMVWVAADLFLSLNGKDVVAMKMSVLYFLFWLVTSFVIGIFFYFASLIFNKDSWSLRKQIIINFFICLSAWLLFNLTINNFNFSWHLFGAVIVDFIIMYAIAYGIYFWHLWHDVREINKKLKQNTR
ncbi:DUF3021 domain-containing protein [Lactobacillus hominis]|uniref:DUF3021 domain-containing protein n=1 Tax=Lactobacillus hominis TaxID=1203033 RepID=UPI0023EFB2DB|nr:DUF3021 domain-containing protein [Lactobacillus hominis]